MALGTFPGAKATCPSGQVGQKNKPTPAASGFPWLVSPGLPTSCRDLAGVGDGVGGVSRRVREYVEWGDGASLQWALLSHAHTHTHTHTHQDNKSTNT